MPRKTVNPIFLIGLILVITSLSWNTYQDRVLSFNKIQSTYTDVYKQTKARPTRIVISKFNINLPVVESKIVDGVWEINPKGASHLSKSANPGEGGNIIIYGHNKKSLFGKALGLKEGDQIKIISEDLNEYDYFVDQVKEVDPGNVNILMSKGEEVLTFYTCTGFLGSKRFVVIAKPA